MPLFYVNDKVLVIPTGTIGTIVEILSYQDEIYDEEEDDYVDQTVYEYCVKYDKPMVRTLHNSFSKTLTQGWWEEENLKKYDKRKSGFGKFIKKFGL